MGSHWGMGVIRGRWFLVGAVGGVVGFAGCWHQRSPRRYLTHIPSDLFHQLRVSKQILIILRRIHLIHHRRLHILLNIIVRMIELRHILTPHRLQLPIIPQRRTRQPLALNTINLGILSSWRINTLELRLLHLLVV